MNYLNVRIGHEYGRIAKVLAVAYDSNDEQRIVVLGQTRPDEYVVGYVDAETYKAREWYDGHYFYDNPGKAWRNFTERVNFANR